MVAVSYRPHVEASQKVVHSKPVRSKSFWSNLAERLIESRRLRAEIELRRYRHLLPAEFEHAADRANARSEDQLPFLRD